MGSWGTHKVIHHLEEWAGALFRASHSKGHGVRLPFTKVNGTSIGAGRGGTGAVPAPWGHPTVPRVCGLPHAANKGIPFHPQPGKLI